MESDENDQENHSDCSNHSVNKKSVKNINQKKIQKKPIRKDKSASLSPDVLTLNRLERNSNDENSNQSSSLSRSARDENICKVKSELDVSSQPILSSIPSNEEKNNINRYGQDSESKNFKRNIDKFKMENEEDYMKHLDKDGHFKYNSSTKRSTSANNSPYKEKKRKFLFDKTENNAEFIETERTHLETDVLHKPIVKTVYYSYFEHGSDERDEIREIK